MTNPLAVLILVCSVDVTPADCSQENAVDVIIGPPAPNEMMCGRDGQAYVAETPFVVPGETYPKIICSRQLPAIVSSGVSLIPAKRPPSR